MRTPDCGFPAARPDLLERLLECLRRRDLAAPAHEPSLGKLPKGCRRRRRTRSAPRLTYRRTNHHNIHVRGYKEEGTTTTPFDMVMLNDVDR